MKAKTLFGLLLILAILIIACKQTEPVPDIPKTAENAQAPQQDITGDLAATLEDVESIENDLNVNTLDLETDNALSELENI